MTADPRLVAAQAAIADTTTTEARRHAHAAVLAALEGDPHGLAEDVLAGAERNGYSLELSRYLVALSGGLFTNWVGERLSGGQVVGFARHYFRTLEGGDS